MTNALLATQTLSKQRLQQPSITLVVVPHERFSYTQQSLESIYKHTRLPFELVYVDAGSPKHIQNHLYREAVNKGFILLRTDHFLSPNQARNIGLSQATTDHVVFINNDIHVSPGWLERLWQCAQETDATVVCPLTCVGKPLHERVHMAGGKVRIFTDIKSGQIHRRLYQKHFLANRRFSLIKHQLYRRSCDFAELSCMLIKRNVFEQVDYLDEKLLSSQQDIDFCLSVSKAGGRIFCEPTSVVTHVSETSYHWSDLAYFMLRWSDAWEIESLMHFQQKWSLEMTQYLIEHYKQIGHRRHQLLRCLLQQITGGRQVSWLEKWAFDIEQWLNQAIIDGNVQHSNTMSIQLPSVTVSSRKNTPTKRHCQSVLC